jgi:hypothetical protein
MIHFKVIITIALWLLSLNILSQESPLSDILNSIAEDLAENDTGEEEAGLFIEKLQELAEKPVNINSSDETELSRLFFLTDFQIKALSDYIRTSGEIVSVFEIQNIPGFGREQAEMIIPFIMLVPAQDNALGRSGRKIESVSNLCLKWPFTKENQTGPPWKFLTKYRFTTGRISGGITAEKDYGEKCLTGKPPVPDFFSANLALTGSGIIRKVIIGDFGGRFGLGTGFNTGLRSTLSVASSGIVSGSDALNPYSSADENSFLRGAALQMQVKKTKFFLYCSGNRIDATPDSTGAPDRITIKSFTRTGLHNTKTLLERKDLVTETGCGIAVSSEIKNLRIGILWNFGRFSLPAGSATGKAEDLFGFRGGSYYTASLYYRAVVGKFITAGEVTSTTDNKFAFVQSFSVRPADRLTMALIYRQYSPGFTSFHGRGPLSGSTGDNLRGLAGNFSFEAAKYLFVKAGYDFRYHPWLKYRCGSPSISKAAEVRILFSPGENLRTEVSYKYSYSILDRSDEKGIKKQDEFVGRTFRCAIKYPLNRQLSTGMRIELRLTEPEESKGILMFQDFTFRPDKLPVSIWFRYCIFRTDDWNSRLYTYENDLFNSFSVPALYGTGNRFYLMAAWNFGGYADLRIKYAVTSKLGNNFVTDETEELKVQLRLMFR